MWNSVKYILIFFVFEIIPALPIFLIGQIIPMDENTKMLLILGIGNVLAGIYFFRKAQLSRRMFTPKGLGKIIALCVLTPLLMLLPESQTISILELQNKLENIQEAICSNLGIIIFGILIPIAEEILFRGAVLRALLKSEHIGNKAWPAIVISALIFSIIHLNPAQIPGAFVSGLIFAYVTYKTNSLAPSIVMHIVTNITACITGRIIYQSNIPDDYVLFGSPAMENTLSVVSAILFLLCLYSLYRLLKTTHPNID